MYGKVVEINMLHEMGYIKGFDNLTYVFHFENVLDDSIKENAIVKFDYTSDSFDGYPYAVRITAFNPNEENKKMNGMTYDRIEAKKRKDNGNQNTAGILRYDKTTQGKAYKELYEIIKYVPEEELNKVSKSLLKYIENNMDRDYKVNIDINNLNSSDILYETKVLLSILYVDYWAPPDVREKIEHDEKIELQRIEQEKREKYGDLFGNNSFVDKVTDNKEIINKPNQYENVESKEGKNESNELVTYKESFFKKVLDFIKRIIKK